VFHVIFSSFKKPGLNQPLNKYLKLYYESLIIEYDKDLLTYDNSEIDLMNFKIMDHELMASEFFPAIIIKFKATDAKSSQEYLSSLLQAVDKNVSNYIISEVSSIKKSIGSAISIANEIEINKNLLELKRVNKERIIHSEIDKAAINSDEEKSKNSVPLNLYVLGGNKNRESIENAITYLKNRGEKLNINNLENDNVKLSKQISTNYTSVISENLESIVLENVNVVKYDLNKVVYSNEGFMKVYLYTLLGLFLGFVSSSLLILIRHSLINLKSENNDVS